MLRQHSIVFRRLMILTDLLIVAGSFFLSYTFRDHQNSLYPINYYFNLLPLLVIVLIFVFNILGLYHSFRTKRITEVIFIIIKGAALSYFAVGSFLYIFNIDNISRLLIFYTFLCASFLISFEKIIMIKIFRYYRDKGYNFRNILVVGTDQRAREFIRSVNSHREWGLAIIGVVDKNPEKCESAIEGHHVIGGLNDVSKILHKHVIDEIMFFVPTLWLDRIEDVIRTCEVEGIKVNVSAEFMYRQYGDIKLNKLHKIPLITFDRVSEKFELLFIKQLIDIVISFIAFVVLIPLYIVIAILIKATSPGPVFYYQERYGLNGRRFKLIKFRTMVVDAEKQREALLSKNEMIGPAFKLTNDPRVTAIGNLLRKASLDELPQIWNILRGEMSLVGPRPPIPAEVEQYDDWHRRRIRMRPGLTCLWQISGRNKIKDFNNWVKLDLEYIDQWSLWLDLKILFKTIPIVLFGIGAK